MINLKNDPQDISNFLIQESGIGGAIQKATDGVFKAQRESDNYALSVWREVKAILRNKKAGPESPAR